MHARVGRPVRAKSVLANRLSESPTLRRGPRYLGVGKPKYNRTQADQRLVQRSIELWGLVQPWKHTNAKRSAQRKDYQPRRSSHDVERQGTFPEPQNLFEAPVPQSDHQTTMDGSPELVALIGAGVEKAP
jgi:hypothetical protein